MRRKKNRHAIALGRLGASKGGDARAAKLTPKRRKEISQKAARKRWEKWRRPKEQQVARATAKLQTQSADEKTAAMPVPLLRSRAHGHVKEWLTEQEVAGQLGKSPETIRKWRQMGIGPRWYRLGISPRYLTGDVVAWVEA